MKFYTIDSFYAIISIKEHSEIKQPLLNLIEDMPQSSLLDEGQDVSKTDWNIPGDFKREYLEYFYDHIKKYMQQFANSLLAKKWNILNGWFQQYSDNSYHNWHTHTTVNYSCVYYLELPDSNMKTEFYDNVNNKVIETVDIKEGDLIIFPAHILHRSKRNITDKRKTVIAFNLDIDDFHTNKILEGQESINVIY